jgi:hypothetical protein
LLPDEAACQQDLTAAKGLVARYAQGCSTAVQAMASKLSGPTDTPTNADVNQQGERLASAEDIAWLIVKRINQGKPVVCEPAKWERIMMIIRHALLSTVSIFNLGKEWHVV